MSNFTKEELKFIWHKLSIADYANTEMHDLPNKVCAMIDNFCDHEFVEWIQPNHVVCVCQSCKKFLEL